MGDNKIKDKAYIDIFGHGLFLQQQTKYYNHIEILKIKDKDPTQIYVSGKPQNLKQDDRFFTGNIVDIEKINDTSDVMTILEFKGIKCSARSFQIDIEIKQLMVREEMSKVSIKLARADNRPNLDFLVNYQYTNPFYNREEWGGSWNAILSLNFPLFSHEYYPIQYPRY